jgi:hypothetical protein
MERELLQLAGRCRSVAEGSGEMPRYAKGDHVSWNSEAGRVTGRIIKVHERDFDYKGYRHRASAGAPQYEIKSDNTDHIAAHKEEALTRIR